jgi:hypothetical protein
MKDRGSWREEGKQTERMGKIGNDRRLKNSSLLRITIINKDSMRPMVNTITTGEMVNLVTIEQVTIVRKGILLILIRKVTITTSKSAVSLVTTLTLVTKITIGTI